MTLLEIMIVIFIIGIIGSVIGYNMRGSMDQGKAFKTKEGISKLYNIVHLEMESKQIESLFGEDSEAIQKVVRTVLKNSGLISKPQDYLVDGWKNPLTFEVVEVGHEFEIHMTSTKYEGFYHKKGKSAEYPWIEEDTDSD